MQGVHDPGFLWLRTAQFTVKAAPHELISTSALSLVRLMCVWERSMCQQPFQTLEVLFKPAYANKRESLRVPAVFCPFFTVRY